MREIEEYEDGLEYGEMFHLCVEKHTGGKNWKEALLNYKKASQKEYPLNREQIDKWYILCFHQFKTYIKHQNKRERAVPVARTEIYQEESFNIPYITLSGQTIRLRGKFDGLFVRGSAVKLEEHKTKSYVDEQGISETLHFNFQTMFYHTVLRSMIKHKILILPRHMYIAGTQYNVIRRPLSSKYPIRQKKSESLKEFYRREAGNIKSKPLDYFTHINAMITTDKVEEFQQRCLDPILESICNWWDHMKAIGGDPWASPGVTYQSKTAITVATSNTPHALHYQMPWGIFNPIFGGFRGPYYDMLTKGNIGSLVPAKSLFRELD